MNKEKWETWVWIKWKPGTSSNAWEGWKSNPKIQAAWSTLGQWDCCLRLNVSTPEDLETFVWKEIRTNQWVADTQTTWSKQWW